VSVKYVILVTNQFVMCEWIHICSDVDSVQIVAFGMHIHNSMGAKCIVLVTRTTCYVWLYTHMYWCW
jgi:hypothetical protein